jgi:hypothetical protein
VRQGIWMIHIVEEIKLLLLPGKRMVMTSRLATVGQTYPRKHIVSVKISRRVGNVTPRSVEVISQTWYTYDYKIGINKYPGNS